MNKIIITLAVVLVLAYLLLNKDNKLLAFTSTFNEGSDSDSDSDFEDVIKEGCTDITACNYDDTATKDDGSCWFPESAMHDCDGRHRSDLNFDGSVNTTDLLILLGAFGTTCTEGENCIPDISNDGAVSTVDLLAFLNDFGYTPSQAQAWMEQNLNCDYSQNFCVV